MLSITTVLILPSSTQRRTRWENSPGDSSAASTCSISKLPLSSRACKSMPMFFMRSNNNPNSSSKMNSAAFSPRATAAAANTMAISDLPVPAGPRIKVLEPVSIPPPSSASISRMPLVNC
ncbi:hypothetical protein D3C81_1403980 [compost metagenome]